MMAVIDTLLKFALHALFDIWNLPFLSSNQTVSNISLLSNELLYLHTLVKIQKDLIKANDRIISGITFVAQYFGFMSTTTNGTVYLIVQKKRYGHDCEFAGQMGSFIVRVQIVCQAR